METDDVEMVDRTSSAADEVSRTPELLEHILLYLLRQLLPLSSQEDPRSVRVLSNAKILLHLLQCSRVSQSWKQCILGSKKLQRTLFVLPDQQTNGTWDPILNIPPNNVRTLYMDLLPRNPRLNPIIQTTFPSYHFRFWHLPLESTDNRHVAYLIISRRDIPAVDLRAQTKQGMSISRMLLAQPPPKALQATIWEERDETKDYIGRTTELDEALIECHGGLTIGLVHERVARWFNLYRDVAAIKLTTA